MRTRKSWLAALVMFFGTALWAQDISGNWQAILDQDQQQVRLRLTIEKIATGDLSGKLHAFGGRFQDWGAFIEVKPITAQGADVKFNLRRLGTFEGKINADGNSIQGTLTQAKAVPLTWERTTPATEWKETAIHTVQFVTVDENVKLEVLDFGGSGRPLVFLAGGGGSAHVWDSFAPKFTPAYHAYAITRRASGDSSAPPCGYSGERMGDDVIAVLDALKLEHPVLVGHSIAGSELSSVGSRHPERVAGLIYLDSAFSYAWYDSKRGEQMLDSIDLRNKLLQVQIEPSNAKNIQTIQEIIADMPKIKKELEGYQKELLADPTGESGPLPPSVRLMIPGVTKYTKIPVPILAIYAYPRDGSQFTDPKKRAAMLASDKEYTGRQSDAFEKGVPTARVVRLPLADHYVFRSNEADVMREMNAFLGGLK